MPQYACLSATYIANASHLCHDFWQAAYFIRHVAQRRSDLGSEHARHFRAALAAALQGASDEQVAKELEPQPDDPKPLSEEELTERDRLLEDGYKDWSKK